jgi:hypothetical protein
MMIKKMLKKTTVSPPTHLPKFPNSTNQNAYIKQAIYQQKLEA